MQQTIKLLRPTILPRPIPSRISLRNFSTQNPNTNDPTYSELPAATSRKFVDGVDVEIFNKPPGPPPPHLDNKLKPEHRFYTIIAGLAISLVTLWMAVEYKPPIYAEGPEVMIKDESKEEKNGSGTDVSYVSIDFKDNLKIAKENPAVWIFGGNRSPRRIEQFQGRVLRDLTMNENYGAAIDFSGNLYTWSVGNDKETMNTPLFGADLVNVSLSRNTAFGLSRSGKVYAVPLSDNQESVVIPWWSFYGVDLKNIKQINVGESIKSIQAGTSHLLILSNRGNVFQSPLDSTLTVTSPTKQPLSKITQIASGSKHNLARTSDGHVYAWGDNAFGQCVNSENAGWGDAIITKPKKLDLDCVVDIAAGGDMSAVIRRDKKGGDFEVYMCGMGQYGQIGNGLFKHSVGELTLLKSLSNKREYNERKKTTIPISLKKLSLGTSHCAAILNTSNDSEYGNDVMVWGSNLHSQLNRTDGKKVGSAYPIWTGALDYKKEGSECEKGRLQLVAAGKVSDKVGGSVRAEQSIVCGGNYTAIYFKKI